MAQAAPAKKPAVVAAIGIDPAQLDLFKGALQKIGIQVQLATYDAQHTLQGDDVNAFIVRLGVGAEELLTKIRATDAFRDTIIYAVGTEGEAMSVTDYEISVLMPDLSASSVAEAVQSTYQLLLHQLRRYARIPIVTPVEVGTGDSSVRGISRNISAGGMSVSMISSASAAGMDQLQTDSMLQVSFNLPHSSRFHLSSVLVRKTDKLASFQFLGSPDQDELKMWIDKYLHK